MTKNRFVLKGGKADYEVLTAGQIGDTLYICTPRSDFTASNEDHAILGEGSAITVCETQGLCSVYQTVKNSRLQSLRSTKFNRPYTRDITLPLFAKTYPSFSEPYRRTPKERDSVITIGQTWHLATNLLLALVAGDDATLPQLPGLTLSVTQFRHLRLALYTGYLSLPSGKSTGVTVQAHLKPRLTLIEDRRRLESEHNMEENSKDLRPHLNEIVSLCQNRAVDQVVAALPPRFESLIRRKPVKLFDSLETLYSSQHSG